MKIDSSGQWQIYGKMNNLYTQQQSGSIGGAKGIKKNQDVISFSAASYKPAVPTPSQKTKAASGIALEGQVGKERAHRIEEIKTAVDNGTYGVSRQLMVDAILRKCSSENN